MKALFLMATGLCVSSLVSGADTRYDAVVAADGSGAYTTVQEAIAAAPDHADKPFVILLRPGRYEGQIIVPKEKRNVHLVGMDAAGTVCTYSMNVYETNAVTDMRHKGTGFVVLADDFRAENMTFENTSGDHGQALALRVDGDRAMFSRCRMLGWQDTLMVNHGRQYFADCYIEGRVDFIYGSATAVFDRCVIHSKNGGYVTAASTPQEKAFGLVFLDCRLTGDDVPWMDPADPGTAKPGKKPNAHLGRPWRPYAAVAFIRCELGDHVRPEGWNNWGKASNEETARYAEYRNTGPGADPAGRVGWAKQLTDTEAEGYTVEKILGGPDHWVPPVD